MRCYSRLLNISYKDHVTKEEVHNRIQNSIGVHDDLLTMMNKWKWPHLKILWHGEDNSARESERSKKERKTEDNIKERTGVEFGDSLRKTVKGIVAMPCGAPTTAKVKGLG